MARYYFVGLMLPDLQIGIAPELSFQKFDLLLKDNLTRKDYELVTIIRRYYDIENLRCLWRGEHLIPYGNLDEKSLEEALLNADKLPDYVNDFLQQHETKESRLQFFPSLISEYYRTEAKRNSGFVKRYLDFERKLRLLETAFRAKKLNRDLSHEYKFEDHEENFIESLLSQNENRQFEPPEGFQDLKPILEENYFSPIDLHKALCEYRFSKIEILAGNKPFSIDRILAKLVKLIIAERWHRLNREKGNKLVDLYIKEQA